MSMHRTIFAFCALALLALSGCATQQRAPIAKDPLEGFNRAMFAVHEGVDKAALKPLARGYDTAVPLPMKMSVGNFFGNFRDVGQSGNALLQGKGNEGMTGLARFFVNSTVGIFGLFDVASEMELMEGDEDFGQTLAVWGVPSGPYLFIPLIGPSGGRDIVGWSVDQYIYPVWHHTDDHPALRNSLLGLNAMQYRASLLPADHVLEEASLDKYAYLRAAYLQRRAAQIRDGASAPRDEEDLGELEEPDDLEPR